MIFHLLILAVLFNLPSASYILLLQHRVKVVTNGRLEATAGKYRALMEIANIHRLYARLLHRKHHAIEAQSADEERRISERLEREADELEATIEEDEEE